MKNFYDILQYLKKYEIYIHVGHRLWDIEVAALEVDNLYKAKVLSEPMYETMKIILAKEHKDEAKRSGLTSYSEEEVQKAQKGL
ncbi:YqgQ family protein [Fructobacillus sp. W13]|uniref:YqgQ family protein n=1 Tax=Fructobacillus apis TaxID=2935017 RepID=A0ABT0ZP14_9LACO|nr:YqgQ family protein [Fructobacillus apis]MCO0831707.1 YqgQ family protein [Fructobacillus apis]